MPKKSLGKFTWLASAILICATVNSIGAANASTNEPGWADVELKGAPTRYFVDVERYRFAAHKLLNYLRYQSRESDPNTYRVEGWSSWLLSLAYFESTAKKP